MITNSCELYGKVYNNIPSVSHLLVYTFQKVAEWILLMENKSLKNRFALQQGDRKRKKKSKSKIFV